MNWQRISPMSGICGVDISPLLYLYRINQKDRRGSKPLRSFFVLESHPQIGLP
jgi:hypothetical protein